MDRVRPGRRLGHYRPPGDVNVPKTGTNVHVKGDTKKDYSVDVEITPAAAG